MKNLAQFIIKYRTAVIIVTLILTLFFGYSIKSIKVDPEIMHYLPKTDKTAVLFERVGKQYGGTDIVIVAIETKNIFNKTTLEQVKQITDSLKTITEIGTVTSLTDVIDIKSTEEGIEIGKLINEGSLPQSQDQLDSLKKYIFSKDMYKGSLISEDATATLVIAKIISGSDKGHVVRMIRSKIKKIGLPDSVKIFYGGQAILTDEVGSIVFKDMSFLGPAALLMIAIIIFINFRSVRKLLIPLITVLIAIIWTFGIISLLHFELTLITSIIPVILLAVGSGWPIHIINRLNVETDPNRKSALVKAFIYVALPVSVAATAAMIGFLTFIFGSYLTMIQQFGAFSALGIFIALLLSLTFTPAFVSLMDKESKRTGVQITSYKKTFLDTFLLKITELISQHPLNIIIPWFVVFIVSMIGIAKLEFKSDMASYFKENTDVKRSEKLLQEKFSGSQVVYVSVRGDVQSPEMLKTMEQIQHYMETLPYIKKTQSVVNLIKEMNNAMGEGEKIPDEKAKIEQLWFLLDGQEIMSQMVSDSLNEGLIQANMSFSDMSTTVEIMNSLNDYVKQFNSHKIEVSGMPMIIAEIHKSIVKSQRRSLGLAILFAFILVASVFKSVKKGLYSIVPMLSSLIVLYGFMGWVGIPIDIATVLVGSIGVGVGDYVIHILSGYNFYYKLTGDSNLSLQESLRISGRAVIINSMSVSAGFLVLILSNLIPMRGFGIIVPITLLSSSLAAITLLPIIIKVTSKPKKSNYVNQVTEIPQGSKSLN